MEFSFFTMIIKLIMSLLVVFSLMFLIFRVLGSKVKAVNDNKYVKVIDRTQITKENSIIVVKVGNKGYLLANTQTGMEKLEDLSEEEVNKIEEDKRNNMYIINESYIKKSENMKKKVLNIFKNLHIKGR
ncbi:flagellar formation protein [Clostridium botulinum]|uniref:flagellar biosynthetic protein FliO n=1 Tax=Clostridium botulinum TaxID=1491 RepID=UPI0013C7B902|nr:flagellar biosynthetic protein FliO [Clostridium botulinum]MBY6836382.1 flagellar biosynthetic protein FliO [Clostridium botulinum]NFG63557.1 flagellar formation protein [Clostridium botulinum]NFN18171.1 flagellar formation protein [Clostridium botulinum]NFN47776.1 flagellar formation protein [Clostridium botulinum]NFQ22998.1 flagellar formation protein [Clostridium botulinum]